MNELDPLDPAYVQDVLSKPPFIDLPGVINFRDLGNWHSTSREGSITKPGYLFRSAELSSITEEGIKFLTSVIFLFIEVPLFQVKQKYKSLELPKSSIFVPTRKSKSIIALSQPLTVLKSSIYRSLKQKITAQR